MIFFILTPGTSRPITAIRLESGCRDNGRIDGHILQWVMAEQSVEHCNYKFGGGEICGERCGGNERSLSGLRQAGSLIEW